jgi:ABC-2 type transport system ATP-binding protein
VRDFLARRGAAGTTILLTTHDLGDIERLCTRVMLIDHGRVGYDGTVDDLRAAAAVERMLIVDFTAAIPAIEVSGATTVRAEGPRQWLSLRAGTSAAAVVAAVAARHDVADISVREPDIEDVVTRLYGT